MLFCNVVFKIDIFSLLLQQIKMKQEVNDNTGHETPKWQWGSCHSDQFMADQLTINLPTALQYILGLHSDFTTYFYLVFLMMFI